MLHILTFSKLGHIIGKNVCSRLVLGKCVATLGDAFFGVSLGVRFFYFRRKDMEYKKEELLKINIHSLRTIGREIGVRAPTALTKSVLIEEILDIHYGRKKPCLPPKTGRPVGLYVENLSDVKDYLKCKQHWLDIDNIIKNAKKELIYEIIAELQKKIEKI